MHCLRCIGGVRRPSPLASRTRPRRRRPRRRPDDTFARVVPRRGSRGPDCTSSSCGADVGHRSPEPGHHRRVGRLTARGAIDPSSDGRARTLGLRPAPGSRDLHGRPSVPEASHTGISALGRTSQSERPARQRSTPLDRDRCSPGHWSEFLRRGLQRLPRSTDSAVIAGCAAGSWAPPAWYPAPSRSRDTWTRIARSTWT